jgi:hypothetical protein
MAPTAIQIEWSGGIVGKYWERRTGCASYERANQTKEKIRIFFKKNNDYDDDDDDDFYLI